MGERDATNWDEDRYRNDILQERNLQTQTVFRNVFAPDEVPTPSVVVVASSDGTVAPYSISSCISDYSLHFNKSRHSRSTADFMVAEPLLFLQGHKGPAYDVKFYGDVDNSLLLSCGDDGRIVGWKWNKILNSETSVTAEKNHFLPVMDIINPQQRGPWGALSPVPENNAIDTDSQEGSIFAAAGDACAYCWDVETCRNKITFNGHSEYLHCIVARKSNKQIITGSEDGTTRIWDCRSGKCIRVIDPRTNWNGASSWIGCVALDSSENWLVCGGGKCLSVWSLLTYECILNINLHSQVQDALFDDNHILAVGAGPLLTRFDINGKILSQIRCASESAFSVSLHSSGIAAVGGYGGLVDILSEFGSHLCTFRCKGNYPS